MLNDDPIRIQVRERRQWGSERVDMVEPDPSTATIDHTRRDQEGTRQSVARGEFKEVRDMAFSNRPSCSGNSEEMFRLSS
jgi:hypothetical protein